MMGGLIVLIVTSLVAVAGILISSRPKGGYIQYFKDCPLFKTPSP